MNEQHLVSIGVPQDVVDAAKKVGMDMEALGKLVVTHTVQAARDFLAWAASKLPNVP